MSSAQVSPDTGSPVATDADSSGRLPVPGAMERKESTRTLSQSPLKRAVAKSWSEASPRIQHNLSAVGAQRPTLSGSPPTEKVEKPLNNKKIVVAIVQCNIDRWEITDRGQSASRANGVNFQASNRTS
jgi:hypothetical protein